MKELKAYLKSEAEILKDKGNLIAKEELGSHPYGEYESVEYKKFKGKIVTLIPYPQDTKWKYFMLKESKSKFSTGIWHISWLRTTSIQLEFDFNEKT